MNVEQLHATCLDLIDEIDSAELLSNLNNLISSLQQAINQPNQPQFQEQVASYRKALSESLQNIESSDRPVIKQQIIAEIGGSQILGAELLARIDTAFTQAQVTPALVQKDISRLHKELSSFREALEQLIVGFKRLGIQAEELDEYVAELGIMIPRRDNAEDLEFFAKDLKNLNRELMHFNELVTGKADQFKIRSISSSDFSVFLEILPETAQVIVSTIALLLMGYEKLLDIRKKKSELEQNEAPKELMDQVDKWAETLMSKQIDEITANLMKQYKDVKRTDHRGKELEGHIKLSVKKIAGRLDVGYHFSARIGEMKEPAEEDNDENGVNAEYDRKSNVIVDINNKASQIRYRHLEGDSVLPITWTPDYDSNNDNEEG